MKNLIIVGFLTVSLFLNEKAVGQQFSFKSIPLPPTVGEFEHLISNGSNTLFVIPDPNYVLYRTTNEGISWDSLISNVRDIGIDQHGTIFGLMDSSAYSSYDNGSSWIKDTLISRYKSYNLLIGRNGIRYYDALNKDNQFTILRFDPSNDSIHLGKTSFKYGLQMSVSKGGTIFVHATDGSSGGGAGSYYKTDDNGDTFTLIKNPSLGVSSCFCIDSKENIIIGSEDRGPNSGNNKGLWQSFDKGKSFQKINSYDIFGVAVDSDDKIVAEGYQGWAFSGDDGTTWGELLVNPPNVVWNWDGVKFLSGKIYVGSYNFIGLGTTMASVEFNKFGSTEFVNLHPNPLTSKTTFSFTLPQEEFTLLKIYNPLGNEIATLINKKLSAGDQSIEFDASHLPSGVYYYRLQIGGHSETKPMVVAH